MNGVIEVNFNTKSRPTVFQFNNSIINEFSPVGKKHIQQEIGKLLAEEENVKLDELSIGLEFTDGETSHFYDSFSALCRYNIYSYTQVTYDIVIAHKGSILKRFHLNASYLGDSYRELFTSYTQKLGIVVVPSDSREWEQKGQPTTLEGFVSSIKTDPLA